MTIATGTISGQFVLPDLSGGKMTATIEAHADASLVTYSGMVIGGKIRIPIGSDGTASVTVPQIPQSGLLPASGVTWHVQVKVHGDVRDYYFTLGGNTTWDAVLIPSNAVAPGGLLGEVEDAVAVAEAARDEAVAAAGGGAGRPATLAVLGTSITAQNGAITGNDGAGTFLWDATGYIHWALIQLRQRLTLIGQLGVGGNTTTQMLARFDTDVLGLSPKPGWLVIEPGPNDAGAGGLTAATSIANITAMLNKCVANGIRPVLCTVTPSSFISTTGQKQAWSDTNDWIKKTAPTLYPGLVVCNWNAAVTDPTSGGPSTSYFKNETGNFVHPNNQGAARLGQQLADALSSALPHVDVLPSDGGADVRNLLSNPYTMGNTAGVATGITVSNFAGSAITGTTAKVVRTDGIAGEWQQIQVTNGSAQGFWQNTNVGVDWSVGDTIRGQVEFDTDDDFSNVKTFSAWIEFFNGIGKCYAMSVRSADGNMPYNPMRGVFRTPAVVIPASTTRIRLTVACELTTTGQATFRFSRGEIRKV